uniref:Uncharacterized protein n=1 Tax=Arundo donax TaxID=35708 RepID=A0A0A9B9B9_ARUDO
MCPARIPSPKAATPSLNRCMVVAHTTAPKVWPGKSLKIQF